MGAMKRDQRGRKWQELRSPGERLKFMGVIAGQSAKDLLVDNGPQWAAAMSYYTLLSAIPMMVLIAAVAAYFVDPQWAVDHVTALLGNYLPEGRQSVQQVVKGAVNNRGQIGVFAFVGLLWTGTRVFDALAKALNVANENSREYSFFKRLLVDAALLLTVGVAFVLALAAQSGFDFLWSHLQGTSHPGLLLQVAAWLVRVALLAGAYFLIYQFVPQGDQDWRSSLAGTVTATVLILIADPIFRYYISRSDRYNLIYGSLSIVVIVQLWVWIGALITLYGGEVAAHTRMLALEGLSTWEAGEQHLQRAQPPREDEPRTVQEAARRGASQADKATDKVGDQLQGLKDRAGQQSSTSSE